MLITETKALEWIELKIRASKKDREKDAITYTEPEDLEATKETELAAIEEQIKAEQKKYAALKKPKRANRIAIMVPLEEDRKSKKAENEAIKQRNEAKRTQARLVYQQAIEAKQEEIDAILAEIDVLEDEITE